MIKSSQNDKFLNTFTNDQGHGSILYEGMVKNKFVCGDSVCHHLTKSWIHYCNPHTFPDGHE